MTSPVLVGSRAGADLRAFLRGSREIAELQSRYGRGLDAARFEDFPELFASEFSVRYGIRLLGEAGYRHFETRDLTELIAYLSGSVRGRQLSRYLSNHLIESWTPPTAVAVTYMHERGMRIAGTYRLHARFEDGHWRIARLELTEEVLWAK